MPFGCVEMCYFLCQLDELSVPSSQCNSRMVASRTASGSARVFSRKKWSGNIVHFLIGIVLLCYAVLDDFLLIIFCVFKA